MSDIHCGICCRSPDGSRIFKERLDRYILIFLNFLPFFQVVPYCSVSLPHFSWLATDQSIFLPNNGIGGVSEIEYVSFPDHSYHRGAGTFLTSRSRNVFSKPDLGRNCLLGNSNASCAGPKQSKVIPP